jgi:hypothetical protein
MSSWIKENPDKAIPILLLMVLLIGYLIYFAIDSFITGDTARKKKLIKQITSIIEDNIDTQINKLKPQVGQDNIKKIKTKKIIIIEIKSDKIIETKTFYIPPYLGNRTISELEYILSKKDNIDEFKKILARYGYSEMVKSMLIKP